MLLDLGPAEARRGTARVPRDPPSARAVPPAEIAPEPRTDEPLVRRIVWIAPRAWVSVNLVLEESSLDATIDFSTRASRAAECRIPGCVNRPEHRGGHSGMDGRQLFVEDEP